jgi:hypothetical protein
MGSRAGARRLADGARFECCLIAVRASGTRPWGCGSGSGWSGMSGSAAGHRSGWRLLGTGGRRGRVLRLHSESAWAGRHQLHARRHTARRAGRKQPTELIAGQTLRGDVHDARLHLRQVVQRMRRSGRRHERSQNRWIPLHHTTHAPDFPIFCLSMRSPSSHHTCGPTAGSCFRVTSSALQMGSLISGPSCALCCAVAVRKDGDGVLAQGQRGWQNAAEPCGARFRHHRGAAASQRPHPVRL